MNYELKEEGKFKYIEEGSGQTLILLHGLFGSLSNFNPLIKSLKTQYNVLVPILPILELKTKEISISKLAAHVIEFIEFKTSEKVHLIGNSLGGHVGLVTTLMASEKIQGLTLTGSSGLFEKGLGGTFPRRKNYEYIRKTTAATFYNPEIASKELVDNIFALVNDRRKALKFVVAAKSAMKHNLEHDLHHIKVPTLLIWGKQDEITPPFVGEMFHEKIENSTLHFIDKCGHAPMMEKPSEFLAILKDFLRDT